jgi:hypothetical protein
MARVVPHPATGKTYLITLCDACHEKARRGDLETWRKLAPFLTDDSAI